jgi:sugar lactone lactonase YvrE
MAIVMSMTLTLAACGGGGGGGGGGNEVHTVGGSISGLTGSGLVLANGSDTRSVGAGATRFTLPTALTVGSRFDIAVQTQPAGLTCSVANGSGVVGNANVNNAVVTCSASAFTLGGSINGLTSSGLVLANGSSTLNVAANDSTFTLPTLVASGGGFEVTVRTQPTGQTCSVANGSGTMGAADVTSVTVTCGLSTFTLGGSINGLTSSGLVLANGGDTFSVAANDSSFTLPTPVAFGSSFEVTVQAQPSGLTCTVFNGSGTMGAANVTSVAVTCSADAFTLGGSISGLTRSGLVLANGSDTLSVIANASSFTLPTPVASGSSFEVIVQTQPSGLTCTVFNGSGTMGVANVASVAVTCSADAFTLGGSISGLSSNGLVLANGSDILSVAANATSFSMPTAVAFGSAFNVTVQTQTDENTCSVSNGSGTMGGADVSSVLVTCVPARFTVSTFAGSAGVTGSADGIGAASSFNFPAGVAVDSVGNLYVADAGNHKIRKITAAGVVSTLAGSGAIGSADGSGTASSFSFPTGVAVDGSGTVYVADAVNNKIRKITAAGVVSTLAGSGAIGSADGSGTASSFSFPNGVAVDGSGTVYVADSNNHKIRKITAAGVVSTLAGSGTEGSADGSGTAASFSFPNGIAVDGSGTVYVADTVNNKIRKITPAGVVSTLAGSGAEGSADGSGTAVSFSLPSGVAVDGSGTVYVADTSNNKIRKITPAGVVSTFAGTGDFGAEDGSAAMATFDGLLGVAVDSSGNVLVADANNNTIRKITRGFTVSTLAGSAGVIGSADGSGAAASFNFPNGIAVDGSGNLYVADTENSQIRKITAAGVVSTFAGSGAGDSADGSGTAASFSFPIGVAIDGSGNLYVADTENSKIRKITAAGVVSTLAGSGTVGSADGSGTAASFFAPRGVAVDSIGTVYVADAFNHKIRKVTPAGVVSTLAGSGAAGSADGSGTAASFNEPSGIAVDGGGNLYVADANNNKIRKITPAGVVSTFAGSGEFGSADGSGTAASFNFPFGVAADGSGNLYVADTENSKIRKITAAGVVSTLAGSGAVGSADDSGAASSFNEPSGIAVDSSGNVLVADSSNHTIRKLTRD